MNKQVTDHQRQEVISWPVDTIKQIGQYGKYFMILTAITLSLAGSACTLPDGDTQCGTPEMPCDEIVTDDILEG